MADQIKPVFLGITKLGKFENEVYLNLGPKDFDKIEEIRRENGGWLNLIVGRNRDGSPSCRVSTWKPKAK